MKLLTRLALLTLFLIGMALPATAQYTTVSSTGVTDSGGIVYNGGTYNITLLNTTGQVPYFQGVPLPNGLSLYSGTLSSTGTFSQSIPSSAYILAGNGGPASLTTWNFTVCAKGGMSCYSAAAAVSGSTQDMTATINGAAVALIFSIPGVPPGPSGNAIVSTSGGFSYSASSGLSTTGRIAAASFGWQASGHLLGAQTAPVIGTCGTSPSIVVSNGTAAFTVNVGTGGAATTCTVTLPTATTGWGCWVAPNGAPQAAAETFSAPTSTTVITISNYTASTGVALAFASGAVFNVGCTAY